MTKRREQAEAPYSAEQMYDLVADVERYPAFVPYCVALRVVSRDGDTKTGGLVADMAVAYKVFREKFRSKVTFDRDQYAIYAEYIDGPFRHLRNAWRFEPLGEDCCRIDFEIDFEFRSILLHTVASDVLERTFVKMMDAFIARANDVYG